jgi:hypothetical protein
MRSLIVLLSVVLIGCKGYKTPAPENVYAAVDGFEKFVQVKDTVFVVAKNSIEVYLLKDQGKKLLNSIALNYTTDHPSYYNGSLFLPSSDGLHVYNLKKGEEVKLIPGISICTKLAFADNHLYVLKGIATCMDTAKAAVVGYDLARLDSLKPKYGTTLLQPYDFIYAQNGFLVAQGNLGVSFLGRTANFTPKTSLTVLNTPTYNLQTDGKYIWGKDSTKLSQYSLDASTNLNLLATIRLK